MSETPKNHLNFSHDHEFDTAISAKKIDVLNILIAAGMSDEPKRLGVTDLELLIVTPMAEWNALQQALDGLVYNGYLEKTSFTPYDHGVFVGYELVDDIPARLSFAGSAGKAIKHLLNQLENRIDKNGIASLKADEWALMPILRAAHRQGISGGDSRVNLVEIHRTLLSDLHDEGVEKWHRAFASAVKQAEILFQPQD